MIFAIHPILFLLFASFLSNFVVLAKSTDTFSANIHQSLLVELVSSHQRQQEVKNRETGNGKERKERKFGRERVVRQHPQKRPRKCEKLNETQKYAKLESVGGRNQIFLAASPREAGRNFPALMPKISDNLKSAADEEIAETTFEDFPFMDYVGTPSAPSQSVEECDEQCREIERKLNDVVEPKWKTTEEDSNTDGAFRMDDDVDEEDTGLSVDGEMGPNWETAPRARGAVGMRAHRSGCHLERFVPIGNCTKHGFEESIGDEKLCTACQGIYVLNRECFPMFVNSVVCDRREFECIYDRFSGSAQGKCRPKVLSFKVMRNRSTTMECEQWVFEYIEVPVACECFLSKRSMWLEAVPPSISDEHLR